MRRVSDYVRGEQESVRTGGLVDLSDVGDVLSKDSSETGVQVPV